MSDEAVRIEVTGRIDGKIARSLRDIAAAAIQAENNLDLLRSALNGFSATTAFRQASQDARLLRGEIGKATAAQKQLTTATNSTAASLTKAGTAANRYATVLNRVDGQTKQLTASTTTLRGLVGNLVGIFGGIFAVQYYAQAQDALTSVQNQIRAVTTSAAETAKLQDTLFKLAERSRSSIEATTDAYVNFHKNLSVIGADQNEILRIVETLNKGFIVSGKSAQEAAGSTRQFIQGLQNGALRGEEFNSIMEGFPVEIIRAFAEELGVSQQELRKAAEQGLITADVIRNGMGRAADEIDRMFANTVPTINNALTELRNKFITFTEDSSGAAQILTQAIYLLGNNLETIIPILAAAGAAFALLSFRNLIVELGLFVAALSPATISIGAFTLGLVGGVAAVYLLAEGIAFLTGQQEALTGWVQSTAQGLNNLIGSLGAYAQSAVGMDAVNAQLAESNAQFKNMLDTLPDTVANIQTFTGYTREATGAIAANSSSARVAADDISNLGQQYVNAALSAAGLSGASLTAANDVTKVAGAVESVSGSYNGVINVSEALKATGRAANDTNAALGVTVKELTSVSGRASGVYTVASALNSVAAAANDATDSIAALRAETRLQQQMADATGVASLRPGQSSGSFTNITGNTSANSFVDVPRPKFNNGGSMLVSGRSGVDKNLVSFKASNGERIDVKTAAQQRAEDRAKRGDNDDKPASGPTYIFNIETPDADSFRLSRNQIANSVYGATG